MTARAALAAGVIACVAGAAVGVGIGSLDDEREVALPLPTNVPESTVSPRIARLRPAAPLPDALATSAAAPAPDPPPAGEGGGGSQTFSPPPPPSVTEQQTTPPATTGSD